MTETSRSTPPPGQQQGENIPSVLQSAYALFDGQIFTRDWVDYATCHSPSVDMYQEDEPQQRKLANSYCAVCPVREACLVDTLSRESPLEEWGGRGIEVLERG